MPYLKILLLIALLGWLPSCTHLNTKINKLPFHTDKSKVLYKLGSPFKIHRKKGLDYWTYKLKINGRQYTRDLIFKEGHSIKKGKLKPYPDPTILLEEAENFQEYEEAVKHYKKYRIK